MKPADLGVLTILAAIWGAAFLFVEIGVAEIAPATLVSVRLLLASAVLLIVLYASGQHLRVGKRAWWDFLAVGLIGLTIPFLLITWGQQYVTAGMAAILITATPLFSILLAYFWVQEALTLARMVGVTVGFLGVIVVIGVDELRFDSAATWGELAVIASALCYAIAGLYGQRAFRGMPAMIPATGQQITGALLTLPFALVFDGLPTAWPSLGAIGAVVVLAVVCSAVAYILMYWLIDRIGATRMSLVSYLVPVFALVYGALFLSETITPIKLLGLGLVFLGVMMANGTLRLPDRRAATAPRL